MTQKLPKPPRPRRTHITTTLPIDLLNELDAYVSNERVSKNMVIENALRKYFIAERARKAEGVA